MTATVGRTELPAQEQAALRRAVHLAWTTIGFLVTSVVLVYVVMGHSQAMKAAWTEDLLSFIPPISFLVALRFSRRPPDPEHPYGWHRAISIAQLVAATALLSMGAYMVWDSTSGLLTAEHPPVAVMQLMGHTVWSGWPMIAALAYTAVPPVLLGRAKMPLATTLHDRVLYADADMNKADWMTAVGGIAGVLGIGLGLWWADAAAALFISASVLHDGIRNTRVAVGALMDTRARTVDGTGEHPFVRQVSDHLRALPWVAQVGCRVRDLGHVFDVEAFVVPATDTTPSVTDLRQARESVTALDWKVQDIAIVLTDELPEPLDPPPKMRALRRQPASKRSPS